VALAHEANSNRGATQNFSTEHRVDALGNRDVGVMEARGPQGAAMGRRHSGEEGQTIDSSKAVVPPQWVQTIHDARDSYVPPRFHAGSIERGHAWFRLGRPLRDLPVDNDVRRKPVPKRPGMLDPFEAQTRCSINGLSIVAESPTLFSAML
jgi:hypothetical protein